ncbi:MAG: DNA polymerase III subunit delta' [Candidatus Omnitrophica bacterium]|nr:DNA polymerase III subunit delta' [Candidatus Omnitrophota bacterium]
MAWSDILGQERVIELLKTHLQDERVAHAYLFAGPDGVGKRRLAFEMAKALNCTGAGNRPCDACTVCRQIARGTHPDVHSVVAGGASDQIKIDMIRHVIGRVALRPYSAAFQVAILEGAERLTEEAANSLLKVLEEPSAHTRFILTTAQFSACLPTIVSRCQLIRCRPLPADVVKQILITQKGCDEPTATAIASLSGGSASEALALADRWSTYDQWVSLLGSDAPPAWFERPLPESREGVAQLLDGMMRWLRDLAVTATSETAYIAHAGHAVALRRQVRGMDLDRCLDTVFELVALRDSLEQFVSPRLVAAVAREKWLNLIGK